MMEKYSVLMSVYAKEQGAFFRRSAESILAQTVQTDDFVLVCDGPLTGELEDVITWLQGCYGDRLQLVRLATNQGLANALNAGLQVCKHDLVARMDSDDIAPPERCEMQLKAFSEDPGLAVVGGAIEEFAGSVSNILSRKTMPQTQPEILRYAKKRNPFNHPTVMFRKEAVLTAGGYPQQPLHEDYALWAAMLQRGARGCNLPQTLCYMRTDGGLYARLAAAEYWHRAVKFLWHLRCTGSYSLREFACVTLAMRVVRLVPDTIVNTKDTKLQRKKE